MPFCTGCGFKLSDDAKFCASCGTPLRDGAPFAAPVAEPLDYTIQGDNLQVARLV